MTDGGGPAGDSPQRIDEPSAKPEELIALRPTVAWLFRTLQAWYEVPERVELDLGAIDTPAIIEQLTDRVMVAALAMRKLQALHFALTPGVPTAPDVLVSLVDSVARALVEAPHGYLNREAAGCDWDGEMAALDHGLVWRDAQRTDTEIEVFRRCTTDLIRGRTAIVALARAGHRILQ